MKHNNVIAKHENIEFKLSIPTKIDRNNKIVIFFTYTCPNTGKNVIIKQSTGIDRYAAPKIYSRQAKELAEVLIEMLKDGYNFITKSFPDYKKINSASKLDKCISTWLQVREADQEGGKIRQEELDTTKTVFAYFSEFLQKQNLLHEKPKVITKTDIDMFMRSIEKQRKIKDITGKNRTSKRPLAGDFGNSNHRIPFQTGHPGIYPT